MSQPHATTTVNNQEEHHGILHKIADKLGIHKKDDHNDSKLDKHTTDKHGHPSTHPTSHLHDNDPNRVHNQDGVVHKMEDKAGIHHDNKTGHINTTEQHTRDAHAHQIGDMGGYPIYQKGARDNDPHHHKNNESPSSTEKIKDKLGMHTDEKMTTDHHHKKTEGAPLVGTITNPHSHHHDNVGGMNTAGTNYTTGHVHTSGTNTSGVPSATQHGLGQDNLNTTGTNYTTGQGYTSSHTSGVPSATQHGHDNLGGMNNTGTNYTTGQTHTSGNMSGVPSATTHGLGQHNLGAVNTTGTNTTPQAHTTGKEDSPGFKEKIKSALGLSSDQEKKAEDTNMFGLPPSNQLTQTHDNSRDVNSQTRGLGTHLEKNDNSPVTGDHNRQGYATTTDRGTGNIGNSNQNPLTRGFGAHLEQTGISPVAGDHNRQGSATTFQN